MGNGEADHKKNSENTISSVLLRGPRWFLWKILVYVKGPMKNAKNINLVAFFDQIRYRVVAIQKNPNITIGFCSIFVSYLREIS